MARRASAAERRRTYLRRAAEIVASSPDAAGQSRALAHVSVPQVARRTGATRGAVYHLWSSQEEYRLAVMRSLYDELRVECPAEPGDDASGRTSDRLCEAVVEYMRLLLDEPAFRAGLSYLPYSGDAQVRDLLDEGDVAMAGPLLAAVTDHVAACAGDEGLRWSEDRLLVAIHAVLQGLCLVHLLGGATDDACEIEALFESGVESVEALIGHVVGAGAVHAPVSGAGGEPPHEP